jgi:hypothetical protein
VVSRIHLRGFIFSGESGTPGVRIAVAYTLHYWANLHSIVGWLDIHVYRVRIRVIYTCGLSGETPPAFRIPYGFTGSRRSEDRKCVSATAHSAALYVI